MCHLSFVEFNARRADFPRFRHKVRLRRNTTTDCRPEPRRSTFRYGRDQCQHRAPRACQCIWGVFLKVPATYTLRSSAVCHVLPCVDPAAAKMRMQRRP